MGAGSDRRAGRLLEVHERWDYLLDRTQRVGTQVLRRLICLCSHCHTSTHFGLAQLRDRANEAFAHLCTVTEMSVHQAAAHLKRRRLPGRRATGAREPGSGHPDGR